MKLSTSSYVPSLRIRAAELQALRRISPNNINSVCPLFTLPPIEFNFETKEEKTDIDTHVERRIKTIQDNWAGQQCWIDVHQVVRNVKLKNDISIFSHLVSSLTHEKLFGQDEVFIPVLLLNDSDEISADIFRLAKSSNKVGFGLRLTLDDLSSSNLITSINEKIDQSGLPASHIDLILDLEAPVNFEPLQIFAKMISSRLIDVSNDLEFRNIILMSTAIPENYSAQGTKLLLHPRSEWQLYCKVKENYSSSDLIFGDYTIVHPKWNADRDMRKMKAAAKVVYTIKDQWLTRKGTAFHSNRSQMHALCSEIVNSIYFMSDNDSYGSKYIYDCAEYREQPSNLTCWKRVAINHHIAVVLSDLAILYEPS